MGFTGYDLCVGPQVNRCYFACPRQMSRGCHGFVQFVSGEGLSGDGSGLHLLHARDDGSTSEPGREKRGEKKIPAEAGTVSNHLRNRITRRGVDGRDSDHLLHPACRRSTDSSCWGQDSSAVHFDRTGRIDQAGFAESDRVDPASHPVVNRSCSDHLVDFSSRLPLRISLICGDQIAPPRIIFVL